MQGTMPLDIQSVTEQYGDLMNLIIDLHQFWGLPAYSDIQV